MGIIQRLKSEYIYAKGVLGALRRVTAIARDKTRVFPVELENLAQRFGPRTALISDHETYTYTELNHRANQYARWAASRQIGKGDTVALFMLNRAEYIAIWAGITRAGAAVALINTNLTGDSLTHCIRIVTPKAVIVDDNLREPFATCRDDLDPDCAVWRFGGGARADDGAEDGGDAWRLDKVVTHYSDHNLDAGERPVLTTNDPCLYIYTSGTTGLPKAANIIHYRVQAIMHGFSSVLEASQDERMYDCLPMYHSVGGLIAPGAFLTVGGSVVLREKFSAHVFWSEIKHYKATHFQYVGELCRYLVNSPPMPDERDHTIRLCSGNGLRPDIWMAFKERFALPRIVEWYAATEGNVVMFNFDEKPGAVGRIPRWLARKLVTEIVVFDHETEYPVRGDDGYCIKCGDDEVGEAISKILDDPDKPSQRFEGYADARATREKILEDAFEPGDKWFRSGDLMRRDALGYFYFVDRIGDTFRWKGENVATSEVSEALTGYDGIREANVYGVPVSGHDGRAGMAALVTAPDFSFDNLKNFLSDKLPSYAHPVFIRILAHMELTGTFKVRKVDLVRQSYNPAETDDPLYFYNTLTRTFERIDKELYVRITQGEFRL